MLLAALIVGLLTAFYFGTRPGAIAAGAALAALAVATVVPPLRLWLYVAVGAWVAGVAWVGPRRADPARLARITRRARTVFREARRRLGRPRR